MSAGESPSSELSVTELEDVQGGAKRTSDNESSDGYDMSQWPSSNAGQGQTSGSED